MKTFSQYLESWHQNMDPHAFLSQGKVNQQLVNNLRSSLQQFEEGSVALGMAIQNVQRDDEKFRTNPSHERDEIVENLVRLENQLSNIEQELKKEIRNYIMRHASHQASPDIQQATQWSQEQLRQKKYS